MNKYKSILLVFVSLTVIYIWQTLATVPDPAALEKYNLTSGQAHLLGLTVALPYIVIWYVALYGYIKFKDYSISIIKTPEGKSLSKIGDGLLTLAIWLPVAAIVPALARDLYTRNTSLTAGLVIASNYINLLIVLYALYNIHKGSAALAKTVKERIKSNLNNTLFALYVIFSGAYVYLTLANPARRVPTTDVPVAAYYLPDILLVLTIVIPYLVIWYFGMNAVQNINVYKKSVKGVIYKESLRYLSNGLRFVVVSLITLKYLDSMSTVFSKATLNVVLAILYGLVIFIALGYIMIALGAKRLQKIENV